MAVRIRFDYYTLTVNKKRKRKASTGQNYFGEISLPDICQMIDDYAQNNNFGIHGKHIINYYHGKKWVKWVKSELTDNHLKLLLTFNDKEVDPRFLTDNNDAVLAQPIPNEHYGQRTVLHIVIHPTDNSICVQNIQGFTKELLNQLIVKLILLVTDDDYWQAIDPVGGDEIACNPYVELHTQTTDEVLQTIQNGGLRGLVITHSEYQLSRFDRENHLRNLKTQVVIRADSDSFINITRERLLNWANRVTAEKSDLVNPTVSLLVKDPQTQSEVQHQIINGTVDGFAKKILSKLGR